MLSANERGETSAVHRLPKVNLELEVFCAFTFNYDHVTFHVTKN